MGDKNINLSASIKVGRKPKDGTDGVGITSADVVFAQSKSNTNPPADSDNWKTKVELLNLVDGYLWSGTKIVYSNSNGKSTITGKYCIGSTRDYTDIEELYYLSDSGDKIPTGVTFQSSFKPEKGKFLWTCIRYRFKAPSGSAENTNWVYSTPTCAGYFGDDGVSVQSSDVMFAIGASKTTAPTTGWITNFSELTLESGKYVWTCTKTILTSSSTPIYTGAYCLGECYDFAQVEELYALSDSSTNPPESGWNASYKAVKGKYLWSCVKVTYNDANINFLNKKCISYFPNDGINGTKFTPKGTAYAHYSKASELPTPSIATVNRRYLVDVDDKSTPAKNTPCVCYYKNTTTFMSDVAAEGDAYNIGGTLWVHDGKVWHDFGSIQGPKGDDGEDALNIDLSTDRLIFDYNRPNFNPSSGSVAIVARHGNTIIDPSEYSVKIISTKNYNAKKASIATSGKTYNLIFKADGIAMITYSPTQAIEGSEKIEYPVSSCNIKLAISYNGITYTKTVFMDVSFAQTYGDLKWNTERLYGEFGEFKTNVDNRFTQTASAISLKADAATLTNFKTEYDENGKVVNKRIGEIEVNYKDINISVGNINDGLKRTGINITDGSITMTANKFKLYNNNKEEVFSADENGNGVFKGKVTATSGNIGGLEIYDDTYQLGGQTFNYKGLVYNIEEKEYVPEHTVNVRDRGFYVGFGNSKMGGYLSAGLNGNGGTTTVGGQTEMSYYNILDVFLSTENSVTGQSANAATFIAASKGLKSTALGVNAYGGKENYAVDASSGDIRVQDGAFIGAFCGNVNKGNNGNNVKNDYMLTPTDSIIVCENSNDITIRFPHEGIKAGQMFIVIAGTSSRINFGGEVGYPTSILCQGELYCGTRGQWNFIIFDGNTWHIRMVWN
nr:MAG TPA: hypothetical protein [Caudoviricetes sp.]